MAIWTHHTAKGAKETLAFPRIDLGPISHFIYMLLLELDDSDISISTMQDQISQVAYILYRMQRLFTRLENGI